MTVAPEIREPDPGQKLAMYRQMLLIRRFEERCNYLFMQGRIPSTLHLYIGQEAVAVGVCAHLHREDYATSTHRPHGHALAKGVAPRAIMAELFAKRTGCCKGKGGSMHVGDMNAGMIPAIAIVGGNLPLTAGLALACKSIHPGRVAVSFFGDGASNEGAFHEALNMAAIWNLPAIYVCENNLYAASTPLRVAFKLDKTASESGAIASEAGAIAGRACAYGMASEIVDGMDVLTVYEAAGRIIERARTGGGPTLLEAKTYRLCGHSRSDPRTYRTKEEEQEWSTRDPILLLAAHLKDAGLASDELLGEIETEVGQEIDDAIAFAESSPSPEPEEALEDVFYGEGPVPFPGVVGGAR